MRAYVSAKVTVTLAVVSCVPASIGVPASEAAAFSNIGTGSREPLSTTVVPLPSERPAAAASVSALRRASATAASSAWR